VPVVFYHNVVDEPVDGFDFCRLPVAEFARQAGELVRRFRPVSLPAYLAELRAGDPDPRSLVFTFDDGYRGVFEHAFPVLRELGVAATVFVITDSLEADGDGYLPHHDEIEVALRITGAGSLRFEPAEGGETTLPLDRFSHRVAAVRQIKRVMKVLPEAERARWQGTVLERLGTSPEVCREAARKVTKLRFATRDELRTLRDAGWTLGSHTRSHRTVSRLDDAELHAEVHGSLTDLRRELDVEEVPFAYPFGLPEHVGSRAPRVVAEAGYSCAFTATPSTATAGGGVDLFRLPRTDFDGLGGARG